MRPHLAITLFVIAFGNTANVADATEYHVAPNGNDRNPGTEAKPFATLMAARDSAREVHQHDKEADVTVWLHGGLYLLDKTLLLTPQDSHTLWRAWSGETPVVSGGRVICNWKKIDRDVPNMSAQAHGHLWYAETPKDWRMHLLFVDGIKQQRSRYPNNDNYYNLPGGRPDGNWPQIASWGSYSPKGMKIRLADKGVLKGVPGNGDAEIIYLVMQYASEISVLRDVNAEENTAYRCTRNLTYAQGRHGKGGYGGIGSPVRIENALIYLDEPGEWCVDTAAGRVYYWSPDGSMKGKQVVGAKLYNIVRCQGYYEGSAWGGGKSKQPKPEDMPSDLVPPSYPDDLRDTYPTSADAFVHHVVFDGITFAHADRMPEDEFPEDWVLREFTNPDAALMLNGVQDCEVKNCRILNVGACGITLRGHAQRVTIARNEIGHTGANGIYLCGYGPGTLDVNQHNTITLNYIHDVGYASYVHAGAIDMYQSGYNTVTDNVLARSTYAAFQFAGIVVNDLNAKSRMSRQHTMAGKYGQVYNIRWNEMPKGQFNHWYNGEDKAKAAKLFPNQSPAPGLSLRDAVPYCHIQHNTIAWNITADPCWWGMEGGGFYSCPMLGDDNHWDHNLLWKSTGFPKSTVLALDGAHACYFSQVDNVVWINGPILKNHPFWGTAGGHRPPAGQPPYLTFKENVNVRSLAQAQPFLDKYKAIMTRINAKGGLLVKPDIELPGIHRIVFDVDAPDAAFLDASTVKVTAFGVFDALRYTLDGKLPTTQSPALDGPLTIKESCTLRVLPFRDGLSVGKGVRRDFVCIKPEEKAICINFQPADAPVPAGFHADSGAAFGCHADGLSYGWNTDNTDASRIRGKQKDVKLDTLVHFPVNAVGRWEIAVPNGLWEVLVSVGDAAYPCSKQTLTVEGERVDSGRPLAGGQFATIVKRVKVRDGRLTLSAPKTPHGPGLTRMTWLRLVPRDAKAAPAAQPLAKRPAKKLQPGLDYGFYKGAAATVGEQWAELLALENREPVETGTVPAPSPSPLKSRTLCGLIFSGYVCIERPGLYTFALTSDDGSRLRIGDTVVMNNDGMREEAMTAVGDVELREGLYPVEIRYFQHNGNADLKVEWEGPGFPQQPVPNGLWLH